MDEIDKIKNISNINDILEFKLCIKTILILAIILFILIIFVITIITGSLHKTWLFIKSVMKFIINKLFNVNLFQKKNKDANDNVKDSEDGDGNGIKSAHDNDIAHVNAITPVNAITRVNAN